MKVEKAGYNAYYNLPKKVGIKGGQQHPQFTGAGAVSHKEVVNELKNIIPYTLNVLSKFAESMGEVSNIIINACGTGLVAPIFIKHNPFSKTDEDTRTYSAWRQPMSAVLAVATQAGMIAPFNTLISDMAFSGEYPEEYNMSNFRSEKYLKKLIKKAEPHLTKDQLAQKVQQAKEQQHSNLLNDIKFNNRITIKTPEGTATLSEKAYKETIIDTLKELIKADKESQKSAEIKGINRLRRSEYLSAHSEEAKATLQEVKLEMDNATNLQSMKTYLEMKIKNLKKGKADKELIAMVQEIKDRIKKTNKPEKVEGQPIVDSKSIIMEGLRDKTNKVLQHVKKYEDIKDKAAIQEEVEKSIADRKTAFKTSLELLEDIKTKIEKGENISVSDIETLLKEKAKDIKFKGSALHTDFVEEMITKYQKNVEQNLKAHKQFTGIVISLAVLPITCCLLNWIYPRFMDAVFPNLSNKKHDNESKQLVEKAPKQTGGVAA